MFRSVVRTARRFAALLGKEWRDTRLVTWGGCLLLPTALLFVTGLMESDKDAPLALARMIAGSLYLVAAVIAADLVAAERTSGRSGTTALLPLRGTAPALAKITLLVLSTCLYACAVVAVAVTWFWANEGEATASELLVHVGAHVPRALVVAVLGVGGIVLLFSTMLPRGMAAAIGGGAVAAGIALGLSGIEPLSALGFDARAHLPGEAVAVVGVLGLAGVIATFARRAVHTGSALRRTATALGTAGAIGSALLIAGGAEAASRLTVDLYDDDAAVYSLIEAPDGDGLLVSASRRRGARRRGGSTRAPSSVWWLPYEGEPERLSRPRTAAWPMLGSDGDVWVLESELFVRDRKHWARSPSHELSWRPARATRAFTRGGEVVTPREGESLVELIRPRQPGTSRERGVRLAQWLRRVGNHGEYRLVGEARGAAIDRPLTSGRNVVALETPGLAVFAEKGAVRCVDLVDEREVWRREPGGDVRTSASRLGGDGELLLLNTHGPLEPGVGWTRVAAYVVDAGTGETVDPRLPVGRWAACYGGDWLHCAGVLHNVRTGASFPRTRSHIATPLPLRDGRLAIASRDGIRVFGPDGSVQRVLELEAGVER